MNDWRRLDSVADIRRGASPRPIGDPKYFGGEVGWVRIVDVTRSKRFLRDTEQYLSRKGEALSVRVRPGDLVMSICGTLGRPIMIDMQACIHDGFVQFLNLREAEMPFLYYALQYAEPAFNGMGQPGTQVNLNTSLVGRHSIFCPNRLEQVRIAEILSALDETIEQSEALIGKYQQIKNGLMHDFFTRGITADGQLRPLRENAPHLYKDSALGWVPKSWQVERLGEILRHCGGYLQTGPFGSQLHASEYQNEGVPVVMPQDINGGLISTDQIARISERRAGDLFRHRMRVDDLIIARRGDLLRAAKITQNEEGWLCGTGCFLLRLGGTSLRAGFAALAYRHDALQRQIAGLAVGTTMSSLNNKIMERLLFPLCDPDEQSRIIERIDRLDGYLKAEQLYYATTKHIKNGLMQDLLTGRVRVKTSGK